MIFFDFYQNLQLYINPIAFQIGSFFIGWYSLMYLLAFLVIYLLLRWRIKKDSIELKFSIEKLESFMLYAIFGAIIGGRIGYVIFYNPGYFLSHPLEIISPIDAERNFVGIYGMSYHGGLLGVIFSTFIFVWKNKLNFWKLADLVIPTISAGYFFGRIGNFLNGELYGKLTQSQWGVYFYNPMALAWELRIPSQLIEAIFEGLILFFVLWSLRNRIWMKGKFLEAYLFGYGIFRFGIEFIREPDHQIGYVAKIGEISLTLGQIYSLIMIVLAITIYLYKNLSKRKK